MCQLSRCSLKGVDMRRCASKDSGSQRGRFGGGLTSNWRKEQSASEDAEPRRGWIVMSHVSW